MMIQMLRLFLTLPFLLIYQSAIAQHTLEGRWWAGVKTGINFTQPQVIQKFAAIEQLDIPKNTVYKDYRPLFKNKSFLIGVTFDYAFTSFLNLTIQPSYQNYQFTYKNFFKWVDTLSNKITLENTHQHSLNYIELPLMIKYGKSVGIFTVLIQAGAYYGRLIGSRKNTLSEEKQYHGEEVVEMESFTESYSLKDLIIPSQIGIMGGLGVAFDINYFRLGIETNYKMGLNNLTNVKNRYGNRRLLNASYDIPDDFSLSNLQFVVQCSTPLDYLIHVPGMAGSPTKRRR